MEHTLSLHVESTRQEIVRVFWKHHPSFVRFRRRSWALFLVGAAVVSLVGLIGPSWVIWVLGIPAVGLAVLVAVASQRRQLASAADNAGLTRPSTLTATEEGLRIQNDTSDRYFRWSNYGRIVDTGEAFVLITSGGVTVRWVPFRAFESDEDKEQFLAWARAGLAK